MQFKYIKFTFFEWSS